MKTLGDEPSMLLCFADLFAVNNPDKERHPHNYPMFILKFFNGKVDDLHVRKNCDWAYLLHK